MSAPFYAGHNADVNQYGIFYKEDGIENNFCLLPAYISRWDAELVSDALNTLWIIRKEEAITIQLLTDSNVIYYLRSNDAVDVMTFDTLEDCRNYTRVFNRWHTVNPDVPQVEKTYTQAQMDEVLDALDSLSEAFKGYGPATVGPIKRAAREVYNKYKH